MGTKSEPFIAGDVSIQGQLAMAGGLAEKRLVRAEKNEGVTPVDLACAACHESLLGNQGGLDYDAHAIAPSGEHNESELRGVLRSLLLRMQG